MDTIRWGLISTARINERLIPAIRASQRGQLVGVASRKGWKARTYARKHGIPLAFGSYEAMLESDEVDVVYISLPNHLHADWTIRAMRAGKHVLCEKPLALSVAEVEAIQRVSQETGRTAVEALMYRHHPQSQMIWEWIAAGRLGKLQSMRGVFNFVLDNSRDIRLQAGMGGGALWDIGIYPVSYAQWLMGGRPESVFGVQKTGPTGVDLLFQGELLFSGGRFAQISCSFQSPSHTSIEVMGSEGRLFIPRPFVQMEEHSAVFYDRYGAATEMEVPPMSLYVHEIEDLHGVIGEGGQPRVSLEESRETIRTIRALYHSAKIREMVRII